MLCVCGKNKYSEYRMSWMLCKLIVTNSMYKVFILPPHETHSSTNRIHDIFYNTHIPTNPAYRAMIG